MLRLARLHDFYLLEALERDLRDTTLSSPRAQQKLQEDVIEWKAHIEDVLAHAIYDYLLLASAGEARHAQGDAAKTHYIEYFLGGDRGDSFERAADYDPIKLQKVLEFLFLRTDWSNGSIGGKKWGEIAKACKYYGDWPNGAFIDYCADLEHNGGTAFSKGEISEVADFSLGMESSSGISSFLTWKRNYNVLKYSNHPKQSLAPKTYRMLERWGVRREVDVGTLAWRAYDEPVQTDYKPVVWGTETPVLIQKYRSGAYIKVDEDGRGINGTDYEQSLEDAHDRLYYAIQNIKGEMKGLTLRDMKAKVAEAPSLLDLKGVIDTSFEHYYKKDELKTVKKRAVTQLRKYIQSELRAHIRHIVCDKRTERSSKRLIRDAHDFTQEEIDLMGIKQAKKDMYHNGQVYYSTSDWGNYKTEKDLLTMLERAKKKEVMPIQEETDSPMWTTATYKWTTGTTSISSKYYVDLIKTQTGE